MLLQATIFAGVFIAIHDSGTDSAATTLLNLKRIPTLGRRLLLLQRWEPSLWFIYGARDTEMNDTVALREFFLHRRPREKK
jgi:hypothetical protein